MALMNLTKGYAKAVEDFARGNPRQMSMRSQTIYNDESKQFEIPFLGEDYIIDYPAGSVGFKNKNQKTNVPLEVRILLIHYLYNASGASLQNSLISFKELKDGFLYIVPFTNRAINPLVNIFGNNPSLMVAAAESIGGKKTDLGDVAVTVPVLPLLPVTCVIWEGDDEFPPSGNILFDGSAGTHLATEDFAFLAGMLVFKLKELSQ